MNLLLNEKKPRIVDALMGVAFNNRLWRNLTEDVCHQIDVNHQNFQVISPWGFEVTNDKKFLEKRLRRFYCYVGVPATENINKNKIASEYAAVIHEKIYHISEEMYNDIVLLIEHDKLTKLRSDDYVCKPNDKLIDVQVRSIEEDILTDYANYLMCTLSGMLEGKGESKEIIENKICRWRFYQLYIIQEQLFGYLLPPLTEEELKSYRSIFILTDNMIQVFYSPQSAKIPPNLWETYITESLIKKRLNLINLAISSPQKGENITIRSLSYHIEEEMELTLRKDIYQKALLHIKQSYLNFI